MSKLSSLIEKGKNIKLGDIEIEINPLGVENMVFLVMLENKETRSEGITGMVSATLKEAVPDTTDEEIKKISSKYLVPLLQTIIEINGLEENKELKKAIEKRKDVIARATGNK